MAARVGLEPTTLRLKGIDSINAPPRPTCVHHDTYGYGMDQIVVVILARVYSRGRTVTMEQLQR